MLAFAAAAFASLAAAQSQQHYPWKKVKILVGYSLGTTSDVFARIIAEAPRTAGGSR